MNVPQIFDAMPSRYVRGRMPEPKVFYFSVGDYRYTVRLSNEDCTVESGKTTERADVVLKTTPELFEKMVVRGEAPGTFDILRGRVKTNDPQALKRLRDVFDLRGVG